MNPPVVIVGAGPTGLNLALSLARHGVPFRIISEANGPGEHPRALAVQARTLEFWRMHRTVMRRFLIGKLKEIGVDIEWLCGCQGARRRVRETLSVAFPGGTYDPLSGNALPAAYRSVDV
jgi:NADPH-dependent 2,4-dienoyl-CoA reductase/sulfur reductase-like enzyme